MSQVTIEFEIEKELNEQCEQVFAQHGLDWNTAATAFVKECVRLGNFPFEITPELLQDAKDLPIKLISEQVDTASEA